MQRWATDGDLLGCKPPAVASWRDGQHTNAVNQMKGQLWPLPFTECWVLYSPRGLSALWKQIERGRARRSWLDGKTCSGHPEKTRTMRMGGGRGKAVDMNQS